jgi:hypothetical protein
MGTKVRILSTVLLDGAAYQPDAVVEFSAATAKALVESGQADSHKDAVGYCTKELGATVIVHQIPVVESTEETPAEVVQADTPAE